MRARLATSTLLASFAACLASHSARAQQFEYAVGSWHYRVVTSVVSTQEVMGQKNDLTVSSGERFTLNLARQARDTLAMTVTVDSIGSESSMGPTPGLDALVGSHVMAWLSPSGQLYSSKLDANDPKGQFGGVGDEASRLLPRIRGALASGATWSDTVASSVTQGEMEVDRRIVSDYTVAGDTSIGDQRAWKVIRKSASTSNGRGSAQGQAMVVDGSSTGNGVLYLSVKGTFLGAESSEEATAKITLTANGLEIHVGTKAKTTVSRAD
jgi:hypothetical protein